MTEPTFEEQKAEEYLTFMEQYLYDRGYEYSHQKKELMRIISVIRNHDKAKVREAIEDEWNKCDELESEVCHRILARLGL